MIKHCVVVSFIIGLSMNLGCNSTRPVVLPGKLSDGRVRLPNGWMLSPAGKQVEIGELPLNMDFSPDERYAVVTNNGTGEQSISVVDTKTWNVVQTVPMQASWLGVRFLQNGKRFLVSGGNHNQVKVFDFADGEARLADSIVIGSPWPTEKIWIGGLDVDESSGMLYVTGKQNDSLYIINLSTKAIVKSIRLPAKPYTVRVSRKNDFAYLSLWGGSAVALLDRRTFAIVKTIPVGDHPNDMVETLDGTMLYVANANHNTVSVIDVGKGKVIETLSSALFPKAPSGSTPNSVALSPDGQRLYIANASNNYLAVMDVSQATQSRSLGFVPVGWYPTCVRVMRTTGKIVVANGKGGSSRANTNGPNPEKESRSEEYIGSMFRGTLSLIDDPSPEQLQKLTASVYGNSPYNDALKDAPGKDPRNPIPAKVGDSSPIKHVFYIIKENRTYDQVFGDMPQGNGDSSLCLFPERITPNLHALAREFVLLDNFYADAEVSADGHNWSMGAYATDYVEKSWPTSYGNRGGNYEYEGGYPIVYPSDGYIWDNCRRHGVSYRTYGEFVHNGKTPQDSSTGTTESLKGHVAPFYRGWDMDYSDVQRAEDWMREFDEFDRNGGLPQFQIIKLPNDHTEGTRKGRLTPRAYVAQNDQGVGMVVERISKSVYWKESAIFVIEDDAQNGPDHVDAHRTEALVISPYTKRHFVDSELYSTSSMVRTMELILGLPPMSQFDAAATPMYNSFAPSPDFTAYKRRDSNVDLDEKNIAGAYGQDRSEEMNFAREDAIPDIELNEIIWKSIHGAGSEMPPPVRGAFVRVLENQ